MQTAYELAKKNYGRTWTIEMLQALVDKGKLSVDEYVEITQSSAEDLIQSLDNIKTSKLNELSTACEETIYDGIDVETSKGVEHFSLTLEDQLNISAQANAIRSGATEVPYHADDGKCRMFSAEEMLTIETKAYEYKVYHTTYFNRIKEWVLRCETVDDVNSISYGIPLPEDLDAELVALTGKSSIIA